MISAAILIFFAYITIITVGLCSFVYSGKDAYQEGMILDIHVPPDAIQTPR